MRFSDVVGQQELKSHLIDEIQSEKISHAQLFLGKTGYGTLPLALAFIQYLFCENKTKNDSCGTCDSCRKVMHLQHPDLHFSFPIVQAISKTSDTFLPEWREQITENPYFSLEEWIEKTDPKGRKPIIGTQQSEEIIKKLGLRSYEGGYKVMLIWMAEEMNSSCANKLLKILEEPPQKTIFILLSESQEQILPTIISRTQVLNIPRISLEEMSARLAEQYQVSNSACESVAARSDGNLNDAISLLDEGTSVEENRELFIRLMRVCYKKSVLEMMDWSEDVSKESRSAQKTFLKYALHMFRQSMLRNYTEDHLTRVSEDEDAFLEKFSKFISGNNVFDFMQSFNDAHYHIERNANPKILFMNLCFQVMRYIHAA